MKLVRARISTTHVDRHNERMALSALEGMVEQTALLYIPTTVEHDIRIPPVGRVVRAEVVPLEDGEFALETVTEMWEIGDSDAQLQGDGRSIPLHLEGQETFGVRYDRSFADPEGRKFITDLEQLAGPHCRAQVEGKKGLEPISTLTIYAGIFAVGSLASSFFGALGKDLYAALAHRLGEFYKKRDLDDGLVDFLLIANNGARCFEVHVIVDKPTSDSIVELFEGDFGALDSIVVPLAAAQSQLAKVVVEWRDGRLRLLYTVRSDAVPTIFEGVSPIDLGSKFHSLKFDDHGSNSD